MHLNINTISFIKGVNFSSGFVQFVLPTFIIKSDVSVLKKIIL